MNRFLSIGTLLSGGLSASLFVSLAPISGCADGAAGQPSSNASAGMSGATSNASGAGPTAGGASNQGSAGGAGLGSGGGSTATLDCSSPHAAAVRLQLLASKQYDNTVQDLFKVTGNPGKNLGDKVFQGLDDTAVAQWAASAAKVAEQAAASLSAWAPCTPPATGAATACEDQIISTIGTRAFRRNLTSDETAQMKTLFDAGVAAKDFMTGVTWFLTGLLQAPDFAYQIVRPAPTETPATVVPLASS